MGYDELNEGRRYRWLVAPHWEGVVATLGALLAVPVSLVASAGWLAVRATTYVLRRRRIR